MVVVTVHLCHDLVQNQLEAFRVCRLTERAVEDLSQLLLDYHAIAAIIKEVKGSMEVISAELVDPVYSSSYEFTVVNLTVLVRVQLCH